MEPVMNLFRISIHPEERSSFLEYLSNLARLSKDVDKDLISFYAFKSSEQENLYFLLEIFVSSKAYFDYLNSATYRAYQELTQSLIQEQSYIQLQGVVLLEKLRETSPVIGAGMRLSLFQAEKPDEQALDRLNHLTQDYVLNNHELYAFYLGNDQQSPQDWYQLEIFAQEKDEELLQNEPGFDHSQVTLRWEPFDVVDFPLGVEVVETRGLELLEYSGF